MPHPSPHSGPPGRPVPPPRPGLEMTTGCREAFDSYGYWCRRWRRLSGERPWWPWGSRRRVWRAELNTAAHGCLTWANALYETTAWSTGYVE